MTQNFRRLPAISLDKKPDNSVIAISDTISYDANGNVLGISDGVPGGVTSRTMSYDGLDRLVSASSPGQWGSATYAYDPLDNLRLADIGGTAARQYRYSYSSISNRLTDIKTPLGTTVFGFGYDARGNQTLKGGQGYQFDSANRLTEVTGKENYRYDGLGRRVFTWSPPGTIMLWQYAQDGRELYASDGRRSQNRTNIYLGNTVLATRTVDWGTGAVNVRYLHTDALGSPVAETGPTGVILKRNSYEPYGAAYGSTSIDGIGYTGHVMDQATGLTYMQQRYYDPAIGRFLSADPALAEFNPYQYATNNPYRFVDPDGRESKATSSCPDIECKRAREAARREAGEAPFNGGGRLRQNSGSGDTDANGERSTGNFKQFVNPGDIQKAVDSAAAEASPMDKAVGNSGTKLHGRRYVYTRHYGWIDLRHLTSAIDYTYGGAVGGVIGDFYELFQMANQQSSGGRSEDVNAHTLAISIGVYRALRIKNGLSNASLGTDAQQVLISAGAMSEEEAHAYLRR